MDMADLRFGVIGWGYWVPKVARNLASLPNGSVTMIADVDITRLGLSIANFTTAQTTTQAGDVFRSNVDGVVIATPVRTHAQPRAHGHIGLEVVRILADVQEVLEVQERQYARAVIQNYAQPASKNGYDAIIADNLNLQNLFGACGTYNKIGKWVQRYTGKANDPQWLQDVLTWATGMQAALHNLPHPLALIANLDPGKALAPTDPRLQPVLDHIDRVLDEAGFTYYGTGDLTDNTWLLKYQLGEHVQSQVSQARDFASSELAASGELLLVHIVTRWEIEVLFGDGKEELGLDQYQLMSAMAMVRFWTLAMLAYVFLEEERDRLHMQWQRHVTSGEARREIQRRHWRHVLDWLHGQFQSGVQPDDLYELLSA